jgi:ATP-dependent Clp protease ATP-binding subunit ClpA
MFARIRRRLNDMRIIKQLCVLAEKHANADGRKTPGSEHFVLAALELPDGTARGAFQRMQLNPDDFRVAITRQYTEALQHVGIDIPVLPGSLEPQQPVPPNTGVYQAEPSSAALMKSMAEHQKANSDTPLTGAHVIKIAAGQKLGITPRALKAMGADPARLVQAATEEISAVLAGERRHELRS